MKVDLHCHTRLSDGTLGIDDLVILAKKSGLSAIAITDHDCLAGTVRGEMIGKRYGVEVIAGAEFTATDSKRNSEAHILCYLPDAPGRLEGLCKDNSNIRKKAGQMMVAKIIRRYPLTPEFIGKCCQGSTNIYKQHIMKALVESGFSITIFGELYNKLFLKSSPLNVLSDAQYPEPQAIVDAIHEAGGIAILAHPGLYDNFELFEELIEGGIDGVEVWHPANDEAQQEKLIALAKKHGLLTTGGSDFHGGYNEKAIKLGDYGVDEEALAQLYAYKAKKRRKQKKEAAAAQKD